MGGYEGHEGHEEGNEAEEGGSGASDESNEGDEGHEEGHESHESNEGHEGHEEGDEEEEGSSGTSYEGHEGHESDEVKGRVTVREPQALGVLAWSLLLPAWAAAFGPMQCGGVVYAVRRIDGMPSSRQVGDICSLEMWQPSRNTVQTNFGS